MLWQPDVPLVLNTVLYAAQAVYGRHQFGDKFLTNMRQFVTAFKLGLCQQAKLTSKQLSNMSYAICIADGNADV